MLWRLLLEHVFTMSTVDQPSQALIDSLLSLCQAGSLIYNKALPLKETLKKLFMEQQAEWAFRREGQTYCF